VIDVGKKFPFQEELLSSLKHSEISLVKIWLGNKDVSVYFCNERPLST